MNICLFNRLFKQFSGGIETYTYRMACEYAKRGHTVHIVTMPGKNQIFFDGLSKNIKIHEFDYQIPKIKGFWFMDRYLPLNERIYSQHAERFFNELIKREKIDVVEIPDFDGFHPKDRKYPIVVRLHGFHGMTEKFSSKYYQRRPSQYLYSRMVRKLCNSAEVVAAVSQNFADMFRELLGITDQNLVVNFLGVDQSVFHPLESIQRDQKTVLFVGRLEKTKGIETIIETIPKVRAQIPDVKFVFVGRDTNHKETGESYVKFLRRSCPEQNLEITGVLAQDDVVKYYQSSTVGIFPSLFEPGGTVAIEAMACGCPTIATAIGGFKEYYQHGVNGLTVDAEDSDGLAENIIRMLQDRDLQNRIRKNALRLIDEKLNLDLIVKRSLEIYEEAQEKFEKSQAVLKVF